MIPKYYTWTIQVAIVIFSVNVRWILRLSIITILNISLRKIRKIFNIGDVEKSQCFLQYPQHPATNNKNVIAPDINPWNMFVIRCTFFCKTCFTLLNIDTNTARLWRKEKRLTTVYNPVYPFTSSLKPQLDDGSVTSSADPKAEIARLRFN